MAIVRIEGLSRSEHEREALKVRTLLVNRFPKCFVPKGEPKRPLKRRIDQDIMQQCPDLTPGDHKYIRLGLQVYTLGPNYHSKFIAGTYRVNLQGEPVELITNEEAAYHASIIATRWPSHAQEPSSVAA